MLYGAIKSQNTVLDIHFRSVFEIAASFFDPWASGIGSMWYCRYETLHTEAPILTFLLPEPL